MSSTTRPRKASNWASHRITHLHVRHGRSDAFVGWDELADLDFDAETGAVASLTIEDATFPAEALLGIGTYAVVIRAPAEASPDA